MQEDNPHRIRHVQLSSGRQIEVVYLDSGQEPAGATSHAPQAPRTSSDAPVAPTPWTGDTPTTVPGEALHARDGKTMDRRLAEHCTR
jgi:hypothetical protein